MGREIASLARAPAQLVVLDNAGHSDLFRDGNDALGVVREWLRTLAR
jgi:fermentation-respiration switch protein FrsA (DUF1100 family)